MKQEQNWGQWVHIQCKLLHFDRSGSCTRQSLPHRWAGPSHQDTHRGNCPLGPEGESVSVSVVESMSGSCLCGA